MTVVVSACSGPGRGESAELQPTADAPATPNQLFTRLPASETGIHFANKIK
jgi:hypothetical protein